MLTSQDFRRTATDRKFTNILRNRDLPKHDVKRIKNCDLKTSLLVTDGLLDQPLLVTDSPESIGMKMPPPSTSLQDIADIIGAETPIKLIEVGKQSEVSGHTLGEYAEYFAKRSADHKTLNLISLEFSATPLSTRVQSPKIVREIDWIDVVWPLDKRARGDYPKVQKYCLAGSHLESRRYMSIFTRINSHMYYRNARQLHRLPHRLRRNFSLVPYPLGAEAILLRASVDL